MDWSISLYMTLLSVNNPVMLRMLKDTADFNKAMLELSTITGLPVTACADVVRNTCEETAYSWREVAARLKREALKGNKPRGRR